LVYKWLTYSKQFKKGKFKNIIIGSVSIPVIGVAIFGLTGGLGGMGQSTGLNCGPPCGESVDINYP